jgi:hypothetical protein
VREQHAALKSRQQRFKGALGGLSSRRVPPLQVPKAEFHQRVKLVSSLIHSRLRFNPHSSTLWPRRRPLLPSRLPSASKQRVAALPAAAGCWARRGTVLTPAAAVVCG